jgi:hypothetical protein
MTDDDDEQSDFLAPYNPFQDRDMPGGPELRMKAYRKAWNQCLERTQVSHLIIRVLGSIHSLSAGDN